jgi:segregation and condensation protein A
MALVEYKKFKEASEILRERALIEEQTYVPQSPVGKVESRVDILPATTLFDLVTAFKQVVSGVRHETFHQIGYEEVSIEDRVGHLMIYFKEREVATFYDLFADSPRKIVAVVTFIALLELVRNRRLTVMQSVPFAEVRVYRGDRYFDELDEGEAIIAGNQTAVEQAVEEVE